MDLISKISDIIHPPLLTYSALKSAIISRLTDSPDAQLQKLLIGDRRPSQLLRPMRSLPGTSIADDIIRVEWLDLRPQQTRRMMLLIRNQTLNELAAVAEEMRSDLRYVQITLTPFPPPSCRASSSPSGDRVAEKLSAICFAQAQFTTFCSNHVISTTGGVLNYKGFTINATAQQLQDRL